MKWFLLIVVLFVGYAILTNNMGGARDAAGNSVTGLDSTLKDSAEGFSQYFNERAKRLDKLSLNEVNAQENFVRVTLEYFPLSHGGKMIINIKDSGSGFDIVNVMKDNSHAMNDGIKLSGRGVELVNQMCDTLEYQEQGTLVTASYIWHG